MSNELRKCNRARRNRVLTVGSDRLRVRAVSSVEKPLDVAKPKDHAVSGVEPIDRGFENLAQLFLRRALLRVRSTVFELAGNYVAFRITRVVNGHFAEPPAADFHQGFIHGDAYEPGIETGISSKRGQVLKSFHKCVLD